METITIRITEEQYSLVEEICSMEELSNIKKVKLIRKALLVTLKEGVAVIKYFIPALSHLSNTVSAANVITSSKEEIITDKIFSILEEDKDYAYTKSKIVNILKDAYK